MVGDSWIIYSCKTMVILKSLSRMPPRRMRGLVEILPRLIDVKLPTMKVPSSRSRSNTSK